MLLHILNNLIANLGDNIWNVSCGIYVCLNCHSVMLHILFGQLLYSSPRRLGALAKTCRWAQGQIGTQFQTGRSHTHPGHPLHPQQILKTWPSYKMCKVFSFSSFPPISMSPVCVLFFSICHFFISCSIGLFSPCCKTTTSK